MWKHLTGIIVGGFLLAGCVTVAQATPDSIAHRGYGHSTYSQYNRAANSGAILEGDIQITKDNKFVIHHDARLKKKCRGTTKISKLKWSQIHRCDSKVIQLSTLLGIAKLKGVNVSLELKANGGKKWTTVKMRSVYRVLSKFGMVENTEIYSFKGGHISKWKKMQSGYRFKTMTGLNINKVGDINSSKIKRYGGRASIKMSILNRDRVESLQNDGIYVSVYTVHNQRELAKAQALEVDGIISDIPIN